MKQKTDSVHVCDLEETPKERVLQRLPYIVDRSHVTVGPWTTNSKLLYGR